MGIHLLRRVPGSVSGKLIFILVDSKLCVCMCVCVRVCVCYPEVLVLNKGWIVCSKEPSLPQSAESFLFSFI